NLRRLVGRGRGAEFARHKVGEHHRREWTKQNFYAATAGKRAFKVADLIALAAATGAQIHQLLDAEALGLEEVELYPGRQIAAAELRDLFRTVDPAFGPIWHAFIGLREDIVPNLRVALRRAEQLEDEL